MNKLAALCILAIFGLSGCLVTKADLKEGEGGSATTRRNNQDQVSTAQRANAETVSRTSEMETSLREMGGRLEVLENKIGQNDQSSGRSQRQTEEQLQETNKKVALLQEEMTRMESQIQALSEQVAATATANANRPEKVDEKPTTGGKGDKTALFDAGEDHFSKKEWRKAILNYQKYRDTQPKGKKFPEATYKIGVCFQELGMKDEAKTFYDELIGKFPSSAEARRAKIRLKKLK